MKLDFVSTFGYDAIWITNRDGITKVKTLDIDEHYYNWVIRFIEFNHERLVNLLDEPFPEYVLAKINTPRTDMELAKLIEIIWPWLNSFILSHIQNIFSPKWTSIQKIGFTKGWNFYTVGWDFNEFHECWSFHLEVFRLLNSTILVRPDDYKKIFSTRTNTFEENGKVIEWNYRYDYSKVIHDLDGMLNTFENMEPGPKKLSMK